MSANRGVVPTHCFVLWKTSPVALSLRSRGTMKGDPTYLGSGFGWLRLQMFRVALGPCFGRRSSQVYLLEDAGVVDLPRKVAFRHMGKRLTSRLTADKAPKPKWRASAETEYGVMRVLCPSISTYQSALASYPLGGCKFRVDHNLNLPYRGDGTVNASASFEEAVVAVVEESLAVRILP